MLRSVRPSVRPSVPFSDLVPFARWRYARVAASNSFDSGQTDGIKDACVQMLSDTNRSGPQEGWRLKDQLHAFMAIRGIRTKKDEKLLGTSPTTNSKGVRGT